MPAAETVLVTGAAGNTGSVLVPMLLGKDIDVRAFVHDQSKAQSLKLKEAGAEIYEGDLRNPDDVREALQGVDSVYLCTWNGPTQAEQALNVIEVAQEVGQPHIVRHSMWGSENSRIVEQGTQVEQELKQSDLSYTILRPTFFMQNIMMASQSIATEGKMYWSLDDAEIAMVDIRDIAETATDVLTEEGHEGRTYTITGPEAISFHDVADALSEELDREIDYVKVSDEVARDSMVQMGMNEWVADGYVELFDGFRAGFADEPSEDVAKVKGNPPRSIDQFARDFSSMFQAEPA